MSTFSVVIIVIVAVLLVSFKSYLDRKDNIPQEKGTNNKPAYSYMRKDFLMTKSENDFSRILFEKFGNDYRVYPQIHLASIVDHKVKGQNWKAALSSIDRKSVDFVICDKEFSRPLCAIELDDWSHESADAKIKDARKEELLSMAGLPLVRINNWRNQSTDEVHSSILAKLPTRNAQLS